MTARIIALLLVGSLIGAESNAASFDSIASNVRLGLGLGRLKVESAGQSAPGWSLISGYEFNPYLSAELGYLLNSGDRFTVLKPVNGGTQVDSLNNHSWNISGLGTWPFNDTYSIFGRLGMMTWSGNSLVVQGAAQSESDLKGNAFYYGAGGAYTIGTASIRLEYQRTSLLEHVVTYVTVSAVWKLSK